LDGGRVLGPLASISASIEHLDPHDLSSQTRSRITSREPC